MKNALSLAIVLICAGILFGAPKYNQRSSIVLLVEKPLDAGQGSEKNRNLWFTALLDAQVRFRLEPLSLFRTISFENMAGKMTSFASANDPDESAYVDIGEQLGATCILSQKFEMANREKVIHYYLEVTSIQNHRSLAVVERDLPIDNFSPGVDSGLVDMIEKLGMHPDAGLARFFQIPVLGANSREDRQLGEIILKDRFSSNDNPASLAREYERLIEKNPMLLLGNYFAGMDFFEAKNYQKSAKYIKEILDITSVPAELNLTLAKSYRLLNDYEDAYGVMATCDKMRLRTVPYLLEKALALEGLGRHGAALTVYQQILSLNRHEPVALLALARQCNDESRANEALGYADTLISVDNRNPYAYFESARSFFAQSKIDKSIHEMEIAVSLLPDDASMREFSGDLYLQTKSFDKAVGEYQAALKVLPDMFRLYQKTSRALELSGNVPQAFALLQSVEQRFAKEPEMQKSLGLLSFQFNDLKDARVHLEAALRERGTDPQILMALGRIYSQDAQYGKALEMFNKAAPLLTDKNVTRIETAKVFLAQKDAKDAVKMMRRVLATGPVKDACLIMGDALRLSGDYQAALGYYIKERDQGGKIEEVQQKIARIRFDQGAMPSARTEYLRLTKIAPSNSDAYYHLAVIELRNKNIDAAEADLVIARGFGNGDAPVFVMLGDGYMDNSQFNKAISMYQRSLQLEPGREDALLNLSTAQVNANQDSAAAETDLAIYKLNNSKYSNYLAQAAHIFRTLNHLQKAKDLYTEFLSKGFSDKGVNIGLAQILYAEKNYARVAQLLKNSTDAQGNGQTIALMRADSYCHLGQYAEAMPILASLRSHKVFDRRTLELSSIVFEKTGDLTNAIRMLEEYLKFPPTAESPNYAFHLGELYERKNLKADAVAQYQRNIADYPQDFRSYERLARCYIATKKWDEARSLLETAVAIPHSPARIQKVLAQTYDALDNWEKAALAYSTYLSEAQHDSLAWKELGAIYFNRKQYQSATDPLRKASQLLPDDFECQYMLGVSCVESGNFTNAIAPLSRAAALNKTNTLVLDYQARCYRSLNDQGHLVATLKTWAALDKKRFDVRVELGSILLAQRHLDEAIANLWEATTIIPLDEQPHRLLAQIYALQGNDPLRLMHLNAALQCAPRNWENQFQLACYYVSKNRPHDAEPYLISTIELNPLAARAHYDYGNILQARGSLDSAYDHLEQAAQIEPGNSLYQALYANVASLMGNMGKAKSAIATALKNDPSNAAVLYLAGEVYKNCGEFETARQEINAAFSHNPALFACYDILGEIALQQKQYTDAAQNFFHAWEMGGFTEARAMNLTKALMYQGKYEEAKDFLESVVAKNGSQQEALYRLVYAYCETGEVDKAHRVLETLEQLHSTTMLQLAQGKIYETEGKKDAALIAYNVANRFSPDNLYAHEGFGKIYLDNGMFDSAVVHLSKARTLDTLDMQLSMDLGKAYQGAGQAQMALQCYYEVLQKYPAHPHVHEILARLKSSQGDHTAAANILKLGLQAHPKDATLCFLLGNEYQKTDQFDLAINAYQDALKIGKSNQIEALHMIGNIYYSNLVNDKKAQEFYKRYVREGGKSEEVSQVMRKLGGSD